MVIIFRRRTDSNTVVLFIQRETYYNAHMENSVEQFNYNLPPDHIAQTPANPRESAKLMVLHRNSGKTEHYHVSDIPDLFKSGDIVVVNNSKVFRARLHGKLGTITVELFLVKPVTQNTWLALGKPGKKFVPGEHVVIAPDFTATIEEKHKDGTITVSFDYPPEQVIAKANKYGDIPVPPYIKSIPKNGEYQTVYASRVGSVAAPTAGFHLTKNILSLLKKNGVKIVEITLHVGLGTFMPIKSETINEHTMHSEWVEVSGDAAETISDAKKNKKRVIAVGTTTVRTLEGVASLHGGRLIPFSGDINIFITPGFHFHVIDAMLTNFHLPKSTLIVLISAFAGIHHVLEAYREAVLRNYRFYSFGDAMFIV